MKIPILPSTPSPSRGAGTMELNISVSNGLLTVANAAEVTFESDTNNGEASLVMRGNLTSLQQAIGSFVYRGVTHYTGVDTYATSNKK